MWSSSTCVLDPDCGPTPGLDIVPFPKLDLSAFAPLRHSEILQCGPVYHPLVELGVQVLNKPLLDLMPGATVNHVPDLKAKPETSLPSVSLVDFTPLSDLIPPSDLVSAFVLSNHLLISPSRLTSLFLKPSHTWCP